MTASAGQSVTLRSAQAASPKLHRRRYVVEVILSTLPGAMVVFWWGLCFGVRATAVQLCVYALFAVYALMASMRILRMRVIVHAAAVFALAVFCTPPGFAFTTLVSAHAVLGQAARNLGHTPPVAAKVHAEETSLQAFLKDHSTARVVDGAQADPQKVLRWLSSARNLDVDTCFVERNGMLRQADISALSAASHVRIATPRSAGGGCHG